MLRTATRRPLVAVASTVAVSAAGVAAWYKYSDRFRAPSTFDIHVRAPGPDGRSIMTTKSFSYLPLPEVERRIRQHAESTTLRRPVGGEAGVPRRIIKWKYDTAHFASNDPIEDANAHAIIERDFSPHAPPGDLLFFAVMDGHGGFDTSKLLSKTLIPSVAMELSSLISTPPIQSSPSSTLTTIKSFILSPFSSSSRSPSKPFVFDADPTYVGAAIKTAFSNLDSEILNAPIRLLKSLTTEPLVFDMKPHEHPMALPTMLPALSGACALLALLDTARRDLYIACTGDSRAVAGYWDEFADGGGKWRVEVLSEDQTGRNPNELQRMQSEHPADESDSVIKRGRVLGGLEPTRAFGDARYKWPRDVQDQLYQTLLPQGMKFRGAPAGLKTPPYVTCDPVITHRKLSFLPGGSESESVSSQSQGTTKSTLRFVVLATDGLWDALSSEEVVSLVGGYLEGLHGSVPKSKLASSVITTDSARGVEGKDKPKTASDGNNSNSNSKEPIKGNWAFVDSNVGTHLIRNAFGGADEERLRKLVSIPPPLARRYRDDVTVTVVWYENDPSEGTVKDQETVKAKL